MNCFIKSVTDPSDRAIPRNLRQSGRFPFSILSFDFREAPPVLAESRLLCDCLVAFVPQGGRLIACRSSSHQQNEYAKDERVVALEFRQAWGSSDVALRYDPVLLGISREQSGDLAGLLYDYWRTLDGFWLMGDFLRVESDSTVVNLVKPFAGNKSDIHAIAFAQSDLSAITLDDIMLDIYVRQPKTVIRECLRNLSSMHQIETVVDESD